MRVKKYNLVCIAPDGDHVTELRDKTLQECINRTWEMGSRWYFYPFHVITTLSGNTVADVGCDEMKPFIGRRLKTLKKAIASGQFNYILGV